MYTLLPTNMQRYVVHISVKVCLPLWHTAALDKTVTSVKQLQGLFQSWAELCVSVLNVMVKYSRFVQDMLCLCLCLCCTGSPLKAAVLVEMWSFWEIWVPELC